MDPFMNQGDQLDQGGKVEVEICWWKLFSKTRSNCARKVREMSILFNVLCTLYFGRGCVSLESEYGKEMSRLVTNTRTDM